MSNPELTGADYSSITADETPAEDSFKKLASELDKYLNNEFLDEIELEKRINTTQGDELLRNGFAIELRISAIKMEENAEMMITVMEAPLDRKYPVPVIKSKGTMFISSLDPTQRSNKKNGKNKVRGTVLAIEKGTIGLVFNCPRIELERLIEMDTYCTLEVIPELITLDRVKFFKTLVTKLYTIENSLMRKVLHYVSDSAEKSEYNWRNYVPKYDNKAILGPNLKATIQGMNSKQQEAVEKAITCQDYFLLHGPPGTGKSHTLVRLIYHLLQMGKKVLVTTHSNMALDKLMVDSLKNPGFKDFNPTRLGDPARSDLITHKFNMRNQVFKRLKEGRHIDVDGDRKDQDLELSILSESKIVFSTQVMMLREDIFKNFSAEDKKFDYAIIDEASQSPFVTSLVPICLSRRVVFAGDHHQLPPSLKPERNSFQSGMGKYKNLMGWANKDDDDEDTAAPKDIYFKSLFERILDKEKQKSTAEVLSVPYQPISVMLEVQYRMNEMIAMTSSTVYYKGLLKSDTSNQRITLRYKYNSELLNFERPIVWVDHNIPENVDRLPTDVSHGSKGKGLTSNPGEVKIIRMLMEELCMKVGIPTSEIAIITPYNRQKELLLQALSKQFSVPQMRALEISTIDSFQGREKEVVILGAVRCNNRRDVGFLRDERRFNVSITRAKRFFIFVGSSETLAKDASSQRLTKLYFENVKKYGDHFVFDQQKELLILKEHEGTEKFKYKHISDASTSMITSSRMSTDMEPAFTQRTMEMKVDAKFLNDDSITSSQAARKDAKTPANSLNAGTTMMKKKAATNVDAQAIETPQYRDPRPRPRDTSFDREKESISKDFEELQSQRPALNTSVQNLHEQTLGLDMDQTFVREDLLRDLAFDALKRRYPDIKTERLTEILESVQDLHTLLDKDMDDQKVLQALKNAGQDNPRLRQGLDQVEESQQRIQLAPHQNSGLNRNNRVVDQSSYLDSSLTDVLDELRPEQKWILNVFPEVYRQNRQLLFGIISYEHIFSQFKNTPLESWQQQPVLRSNAKLWPLLEKVITQELNSRPKRQQVQTQPVVQPLQRAGPVETRVAPAARVAVDSRGRNEALDDSVDRSVDQGMSMESSMDQSFQSTVFVPSVDNQNVEDFNFIKTNYPEATQEELVVLRKYSKYLAHKYKDLSIYKLLRRPKIGAHEELVVILKRIYKIRDDELNETLRTYNRGQDDSILSEPGNLLDNPQIVRHDPPANNFAAHYQQPGQPPAYRAPINNDAAPDLNVSTTSSNLTTISSNPFEDEDEGPAPTSILAQPQQADPFNVQQLQAHPNPTYEQPRPAASLTNSNPFE